MTDSIFDVAVIGAGVVGCSIARELSRFKLKVVVLERESDAAEGASGANSGVIHSGFKEPHLSLKARYCVEGSRRFKQIASELDVPFRQVGTYTVGETETDRKKLEELLKSGEAAGAQGLRIIDIAELKEREPHVQGKIALFAPEGGITDPHEYVIALAENAAANGVRFCFNSEVVSIRKKSAGYLLKTACGLFTAQCVVNSAGAHAGDVGAMVGYGKYKINPCRGEYFVLDKKAGRLINGMIYPMPPEKTGGIGVHLTPTMAGNILIGPSAEYVGCKDDVKTTAVKMRELFAGAVKLVPGIKLKDVIHEYAGMRAKIIEPGAENKGDFVIEEQPEGFVQLFGIESPGLTAAPVIAEKVRELIGKNIRLEENPRYTSFRKRRVRFSELTPAGKARLIEESPGYGVIVCRCEEVTRQEILDALHNPLGVRTLKGVRIRTRAGMGRCQGGFCTPKILEIVSEEFPEEKAFTLKGVGSALCSCDIR